jgi:hypothetical protein
MKEIFYMYKEERESVNLFFIHFHTFVPISTKFGMMVEYPPPPPGEVMNTQKHPQTFWKPQEKKIFFFIA